MPIKAEEDHYIGRAPAQVRLQGWGGGRAGQCLSCCSSLPHSFHTPSCSFCPCRAAAI